MNFFKKLFSKLQKKDKADYVVNFEKEREKLSKLGLSTREDLKSLVIPLIKEATKVVLQEPSDPPKDNYLKSQFGGDPYFEKGESWPTTEEGKPLDFVFQVFNKLELELPNEIKLVQFYYDLEEIAFDTEDDGWLIKIYNELDEEKAVTIDRPKSLESRNYCELVFESCKTLPDWESLVLFNDNAEDLSCILNEDQPWEAYESVVEEIIGEQNYQSQLGGYARWVQGNSYPKNSKGERLQLLFQVDSEDKADLMWGDVGLIYFFWDKEVNKVYYELQCH